MKHTPGPWEWRSIDGGWDGVDSSYGLICKLSLNNRANARLIATAPKLLKACKAALAKCPFPVGAALVKEQLQIVIAEAEE